MIKGLPVFTFPQLESIQLGKITEYSLKVEMTLFLHLPDVHIPLRERNLYIVFV